MLTIKIDGLERALNELESQRKNALFSAAIALSKTAKDVQARTYQEFTRVFDRPTPMTMKSLWVKTAKPNDLSAMVYMKDKPLGGKNPLSMAEMLGHHFYGGTRTRKALEGLLTRYNFMLPGEFLVQGSGARLDAYGNISRGQIQQIISQLKIKRAGFDNTPTASARSRRNVRRAGIIFWSYGPDAKRTPLVDKQTGIEYGYKGGSASHLAKGAWVRVGRTIAPLLLVVKSVSYKRRINWEALARPVIQDNFWRHFETAFNSPKPASKTAR